MRFDPQRVGHFHHVGDPTRGDAEARPQKLVGHKNGESVAKPGEANFVAMGTMGNGIISWGILV
jgi:hypothetical protein